LLRKRKSTKMSLKDELPKMEVDAWGALRQTLKLEFMNTGMTQEEADEAATIQVRRDIRKG